MRVAAAALILCLISGGALAAGFILPREPAIDILDGPAYASIDLFLEQQEKIELAVNPQVLGSVEMTDTTTLPTGTVIHPYGSQWTLTCTYLGYTQNRTADSNGHISWSNLHWGVYQMVQTATAVRMVANGTKWDFGWVAGYPKRLVVCAIDLNRFALTRTSSAIDWGVYWYDAFKNESAFIWYTETVLHDPEVVTFNAGYITEGTRKATKAELRNTGEWYWDKAQGRVYVFSSAEPVTVKVGRAVDFNGDPIVGRPDLGAIEWRPGLP